MFAHGRRQSVTRFVSFVGPLPPPLNGFSSVCLMMLERLRETMPVEVFNRAPNLRSPAYGTLQQLLNPARFFCLCLVRRELVLYLALSGGRGQLLDLIYVLIGKLFRRPIFIHHHSFVYINSPTWINRLFFSFVRSESHIVLSPNMGESLARRYSLNSSTVRVVSNAAFFDAEDGLAPVPHGNDAPMQLGFLSNITLAKGIVEFFSILENLQRHGVKYRAHIAGPVAPEARQAFDDLLAAAHDVEYFGALYDAQKAEFYRRLDVFLFPTNYSNEAEPLVIYEAMRQGAHVIACDRGSIAEMLRNGAGLTFPNERIVESATAQIANFAEDRTALSAAKRKSMEQVQRVFSASKLALENLLASMRGQYDHVRAPQ
jgi:glycosyltransferase involved in cell wall biosynthesis